MILSVMIIFTGVLYSVMNLFNAQLSKVYGNYLATIIIHIVGLVIIGTIVLAKKEKLKQKAPPWMFVGGGLGLVTVVASNVGILAVGVTATLALALIGQILISMLVDQFGWFGFPKTDFHWKKLISLTFSVIGTLVMLLWPEGNKNRGGNQLFSIMLVLISGGTIVLARITNAKLAEKTSLHYSSLMNYIVGLTGAIVLFFITGGSFTPLENPSGLSITAYIGGALGLASVYLCSYITPKVSAVHFTLILFLGQLFSGIAIDFYLEGSFSIAKALGGLLVTIGMIFNVLDRKNIQNQGEEISSTP